MNVSRSNSSVELPHLRISLHGNCNMRCIYCPPWGENSYTIDDNLDTCSLKSILSYLSEARFRVVKFTGGEPTLRKDLIDVVEFSSELFPETRIITNGWNLSKIASNLKLAGLKIIEISLDAAEPASYAKMTQTSTSMYAAVRTGIEECIGLGFPIQLNTVVTRQNFDQVVPMLRLVESFGNVTLKLLELVYYEYPGYQFWKDNYVSMDEVIPIVQSNSQGTDWVYPPGNVGSPMPGFALDNNTKVIVKDGVVGTTYAHICNSCSVFPCQDGLYGLTLTTDGYLKMCKHRTDLHVPLFELQEGRRIFSEQTIQRGVQEIVSRYDSLYFREKGEGGWTPDIVELHKAITLVQPAPKVLKWYRKKEYGNGYEESINKRFVQPLPASSDQESSSGKRRDEEIAAASPSDSN
jgi:cyclic pyranopterin phosphate synthase